jgi:putative copper resistance protein D
MTDWPAIAARLALYVDLGLLFGIPLFALHAGRDAARQGMLKIATLGAVLAGAGIAISLLGFALQIAGMSGTALGDIDPAIASAVLGQTAVGWALVVRLAALAVALGIALLLPASAAKHWLLMISGGIALATLAWSGHGVASEGAVGIVHAGADIIHLLAASAWIGALALLLMLVSPRGSVSLERVEAAHAALAGFGAMGTILVGLIVATGVVNGVYLVGTDRVMALGSSPYGQLLLVKLMLFLAMLACAGANRFWLTPALATAIGREPTRRALALLRRSVAIEVTFALLVLGLVAWLGTLEPPISGV